MSRKSCFGAASLSQVLLIISAKGLLKLMARSKIWRFRVNGGLEMITSQWGGSYS